MYSKVFTIARFTIIESLRNRFLLLSFLVIAVSFALVEFIGDLTIAEHRVTQVAILAAFLRMSAVVIITLFVVSSTVRELHDKTLEMILAMPIRRGSYYLGKLIGYLYLAVLLAVIFSVLLFTQVNAQTVDEILANYFETIGQEKLLETETFTTKGKIIQGQLVEAYYYL